MEGETVVKGVPISQRLQNFQKKLNDKIRGDLIQQFGSGVIA